MKITANPKSWIAFVTLVIASLSLAGCFHGKSHHGGEKMFEYLSWKLDLNDEQQLLLDEVQAELKKARQETREQRQQDKAALIALIESDTLDTQEALALFNRKQATMNTYAPAMLDKLAALHATLNPEQKATIIERINTMSKRYGHKHHE